MAPLRISTRSLLLPGRALRPAAAASPAPRASDDAIHAAAFTRSYHRTRILLTSSPNNDNDKNNLSKKESGSGQQAPVREREELNPRRSEGTKSGTDDQVAEKTDAAFNPARTDPGAERESAARESNGSPLEASGANQEFSRPRNPAEAAADKTDKQTRSGGGGGKKHGKVSAM